jgi:hypothetical protein
MKEDAVLAEKARLLQSVTEGGHDNKRIPNNFDTL